MEEPFVAEIPSMVPVTYASNIVSTYYTQPEPVICADQNGRCTLFRGQVLGGGSVINGMTYNRGSKSDFDGWSKMGNVGWSYDEVLSYFKKSEDAEVSQVSCFLSKSRKIIFLLINSVTN